MVNEYPINTILYAKGWYAHRGDVDTMWLDLIHTIDADGWTLRTKAEVASWCLHRFDDFKKTIWKDNDYFCLSNFFGEMQRNRDLISYHNNRTSKLELDENDYIIWTFMSYLQFLELKNNGINVVRPSEYVLPLLYHEAWVEHDYHGNSKKWHCGEMKCDVDKRIADMFPDAPEQEFCSYNCSFEEIESRIKGKKLSDVLVLSGTDSLNNCEERVVSGGELNYHKFANEKTHPLIDLGIYDGINFDTSKKYVIRYTIKVTHYDFMDWEDDYEYILKSVKEYDE